MKLIRISALVAALVLPFISVTSCNTMEGFGKDMQGLGRDIEDKAADDEAVPDD